jgi:hypothetical protein
MFKRESSDGQNNPERSTKKQLPLAVIGAILCGAIVYLNFSHNTFAVMGGAIVGAVGAYYYG